MMQGCRERAGEDVLEWRKGRENPERGVVKAPEFYFLGQA